MKSDFMLAINQLCSERKLAPEVVVEAVEAALISAYKRNFGSATNIEARVEPNTGDVRVYALKEVVEDVQDRKTQISLPEARRVSPNAEMGTTIMIESTPRDFGRIAAQNLLKTSAPLGKMREQIHDFQNISLFVTFHPAALLRNPHWKRPVWEDMQKLRHFYDDKLGDKPKWSPKIK